MKCCEPRHLYNSDPENYARSRKLETATRISISVSQMILFLVAVLTLLLTNSGCNRSARSDSHAGKTGNSVTEAPSRLICGKQNDGLVHIPTNWATFVPPAKGQSYTDPAFGCAVKRLTDSSIDETDSNGAHLGLTHGYSTYTPLNSTDTLVFIWGSDGTLRIRDTTGNVAVSAANMPGMNNGHPLWDASNGNVFYYTSGNTLYKGTVGGSSVVSTVVHTFTEYSAGINSPDNADLSKDGDHILLVGQNANNTMDVFVWSLSLQSKTSKYTTSCTISGSVTGTNQPGCVHGLLLAANNLPVIGFGAEGSGAEQGDRLWNGSSLIHLQDFTNHIDVGSDLNGNPVYLESGNSTTLAGITNPCPSGWGLDVRQMNNTSSAICLLDNQPAWHISYRGSASQPWSVISFFQGNTPGPEFFTNDGNYQAPSSSNWALYEDELILARIDANNSSTKIYRLAHARTRAMEDFGAQPHAAISRDGKYVIFDSNMAHPNGCSGNWHVSTACTDVFMINVQ